jgi:hypothetical protein
MAIAFMAGIPDKHANHGELRRGDQDAGAGDVVMIYTSKP